MAKVELLLEAIRNSRVSNSASEAKSRRVLPEYVCFAVIQLRNLSPLNFVLASPVSQIPFYREIGGPPYFIRVEFRPILHYKSIPVQSYRNICACEFLATLCSS